jgi:DNA invertase Pin-like site-specific DNA recombinase
MIHMSHDNKIQTHHLERCAYIYIRQSTITQVRDNTASTARQYDLEKRALALGWNQARITIVDEDQARSGGSTVGRDGFRNMLLEIVSGSVGAIFSLESSRLARDNSDWQNLVKACALSGTLFIYESSVLDPRLRNDRLLLGFEGTFSELEYQQILDRMMGGKIRKATEGNLRIKIPVGYLYDRSGKLRIDPDEEVQHCIHHVFELFEQFGTANKVLTFFHDNDLLIPRRGTTGGFNDPVEWGPLTRTRLYSILHNPTYAGAYAYGRTKQKHHATLEGSATIKHSRTKHLPQSQWTVLITNSHEGYITWEKHLANIQQLNENRNLPNHENRGAPRRGSALLQGIVLCGKCGRKMRVVYNRGSGTPQYLCNTGYAERLSRFRCQLLSGVSLDYAVAKLLLQQLVPVQVELSLRALKDAEIEAKKVRKQKRLRYERAKYEADLAYKRFINVDPEYRLVARNLEREWNEKLTELEKCELEAAFSSLSIKQTLSADEKQEILRLANTIPEVWRADTTTNEDRKQLLRCFIKTITMTKMEEHVHLDVCWITGAHTYLDVSTLGLRQTHPDLVALIRRLAVEHCDSDIAEQLRQQGIRTKFGLMFTAHRVRDIRKTFNIPRSTFNIGHKSKIKQNEEGRYSLEEAARILGLHGSTVREYCKSGLLDGVQRKPHSYWWINITPEVIERIRNRKRLRNDQGVFIKEA